MGSSIVCHVESQFYIRIGGFRHPFVAPLIATAANTPLAPLSSSPLLCIGDMAWYHGGSFGWRDIDGPGVIWGDLFRAIDFGFGGVATVAGG
jgi:hypothetical protein